MRQRSVIWIKRQPVPETIVGPNAVLTAAGIPNDADGAVLWRWWLTQIPWDRPLLDAPLPVPAGATLGITEDFTVHLERETRSFTFRLRFESAEMPRDVVVETYADVEKLRREGILFLIWCESLGEVVGAA